MVEVRRHGSGGKDMIQMIHHPDVKGMTLVSCYRGSGKDMIQMVNRRHGDGKDMIRMNRRRGGNEKDMIQTSRRNVVSVPIRIFRRREKVPPVPSHPMVIFRRRAKNRCGRTRTETCRRRARGADPIRTCRRPAWPAAVERWEKRWTGSGLDCRKLPTLKTS